MSSIHYKVIFSLFRLSLTDEMPNEKAKETIRAKCASYLERAEKLKKFIKGGKKAVPDGGGGGGGGSSGKKWVADPWIYFFQKNVS